MNSRQLISLFHQNINRLYHIVQRTSVDSLQAYLHQMIKNAKAFIFQPLAATLFLIVALLGASIEIGVKRSHWYDVLAGFILGALQAIYQVCNSGIVGPTIETYNTGAVSLSHYMV